MNLERKQIDQATVTLSSAELVLVNNALNELCNGISLGDDEFQTRVGVERKVARKLLAEVGRVLAEMHKG